MFPFTYSIFITFYLVLPFHSMWWSVFFAPDEENQNPSERSCNPHFSDVIKKNFEFIYVSHKNLKDSLRYLIKLFYYT